MKRESHRDTWVEVSLDAIRGNTRAFKEHLSGKSKLLAVVKADGYGHGAEEVGKAALEAGADGLGVAILDEALELRQARIEAPILILGYTKPEAVKLAVEQDIILTVYSEDVIKAIEEACNNLKKRAKVHLKIDTGMTRIGVQSKEEALKLVETVDSDWIEVEGIFTHFADADNPDDTYTKKQFARFQEVVEYLEAKGHHIPIKHCCNSAATIRYPDMHLNMCRVGISLYGLYPGEHLKELIQLKQAMTFQTKPTLVKNVEKNQPVSYGCTFIPERPSIFATLPVGYADGLSRTLSSKGEMTVKGKRVPIVGRVCMDQTVVDVTDVDSVTEADVVTIFGDENKGHISLDELADRLDTIHYEIVCLIGKRVPRIYK